MHKIRYYKKDWILFEEVANEGGRIPKELDRVKMKEDDPNLNKHVPFIEETNEGYIVKVGKKEYHANDSKHHIILIDLQVDNTLHRVYLERDKKPEIHFKVPKGKKVVSHAFCNLHGLYKFTLK